MRKLQTTELPPLDFRAAVGSVNQADRTVDLIFSTGAAVDRIDYTTGRRYREVLSLDPAHVRLDRLNAGAPLLNSHDAFSVTDILGSVEPGSARVAGGQGLATVRFSQRDDVEPIFQDVADGIIRHVSVGYRVATYEETTTPGNSLPTRTAIDWTPYELSLVAIPADAGARVRSDVDRNACTIVTREATPGLSLADQLREFRYQCAKRAVFFPPELKAILIRGVDGND